MSPKFWTPNTFFVVKRERMAVYVAGKLSATPKLYTRGQAVRRARELNRMDEKSSSAHSGGRWIPLPVQLP